jgi:hypothetical protein
MAKAKRWLILCMAAGMAAGWLPDGIAQQPRHSGSVQVGPPSDKPSGRVTQLVAQPSQRPSRSLPLPQNFSGWQKKSSSTSPDPAQADAANAAVLREFGFTLVESATYVRNGRKLQIKAARFVDDAGAFGAFSFYRQPEMQPDQFGDYAVSDHDHVIFVRGNLLVQAVFERPSAMSAAELRSLASELPASARSGNSQPPLLDYLPRQGLAPDSTRYILGPQAYAASSLQSPLPASLVGFNRSPEIAAGHYTTPEGEAGVLVIEYPTPQIALERVRAMRDFFQHPGSSPGAGSTSGNSVTAARTDNVAPVDILSPVTLAAGDDGEITVKRTGPLVAVVYGAISAREANDWAASINYDAQVTWDEPTKIRPQDNIGGLIVGIFLLIGLLIAVFLLLVIFFGGLAVILRRFFPNYNFRGNDDLEIIKLNLRE